MTYRKSTDDIGWERNMAISKMVRMTGYPLSTVLELKRSEIVYDGKSLLVKDNLYSEIPNYFDEYLRRSYDFFPNTDLLFPTLKGRSLQPAKFSKQFKRLLLIAGIKSQESHPSKISSEEWYRIEQLRFSVQRLRYQSILAGMFCAFLGLRPSEVAKLKKSDIDFCGSTIKLFDTKSQKDQLAPILSIMVDPLHLYLSHLGDRDPLFIRLSGKQWNRRDVCRAVSNYGKNLGLNGVTPKRLRPTLATELAKAGVPLALISALLRHKNIVTSIRYYIHPEISDIKRFFDNLGDFPSLDDSENQDNEFSKYPDWFFDQDDED